MMENFGLQNNNFQQFSPMVNTQLSSGQATRELSDTTGHLKVSSILEIWRNFAI